MFENISTAPADPILGLTEAFKRDSRTNKINLSVGVFQDGSGTTPVLATVKEAERRLVEQERTKNYKPIDGDPEYDRAVQELALGADSPLLSSGRAFTAHTPGGTGSLRVWADFLAKHQPKTTVWLSDPTWANHAQIFNAAGLATKTYPYFDKATNGLAFDALLSALERIPSGDWILLHACCHNPTGVDPTPAQWSRIGELLAKREIHPFVDFAYQGFGSGLEEDAQGVRSLLKFVDEVAISTSYSKNFGLYNERTGALTVVAKSRENAAAVQSQVKVCIRANYSNPPAHGGSIVATILKDSGLRAEWQKELAGMRARIANMRRLFVDTLKSAGVTRDFSFIAEQKGMFSFTGLTPAQVQRLQEEDAIYIVSSGRINVAGLNEQNTSVVCKAIASVL